MSKLSKLILQEIKKVYSGEPLERGGTSRAGSPSPSVIWLFNHMNIPTDAKIIDFGAGKFGRNSNWLRKQGYRVYSYDKFNGTNESGWKAVSSVLPKTKFDFGFTSYVLNVVPEKEEKEIISILEGMANVCYHITRNRDVIELLKKSLATNKKEIVEFFKNELNVEKVNINDESVLKELANYGFPTSRGFQRIPQLEEYSQYKVIKEAPGWKVYAK